MESETFECSICMSLMVEPIRISCSHLFCLSCLERLILDDNCKCPMDRIKFDFSSDLKFDEEVFKKNFENHNQEFKEKAEKIVKERIATTGSNELHLHFGNTHELLSTADDNQHRWGVFVEVKKSSGKITEVLSKLRKACNLDKIIEKSNISKQEDDKEGLSSEIEDFEILDHHIIKKVTFMLHPTFTPSTVYRTNAPFSLTRIGWGVFNIQIRVEFQDYLNLPKLSLDHFLSFSRNVTSSTKSILVNMDKVKQHILGN